MCFGQLSHEYNYKVTVAVPLSYANLLQVPNWEALLPSDGESHYSSASRTFIFLLLHCRSCNYCFSDHNNLQ